MSPHDNNTRYNATPDNGWTALQYAARVLSAAEQVQFEARLAEDQAAREAVAQAVDLAHSVTLLHLCAEAENSVETTAVEATNIEETAKIFQADSLLSGVSAAVSATAGTSIDSVVTTPAPRFNSQRRLTGWWVAAAAVCVAIFAWQQGSHDSAPSNDPAADVTSAWAGLSIDNPANNAGEEVSVESIGLREIPRATEEALLMDWLVEGLRNDLGNRIETTPNNN